MGWLDNLYCDKKILERLADFDNFKKFAIEKTGKIPDLKGYLYLIEITINTIINDTGYLIDGELYNILHWGETEQYTHEVRPLLKDNNIEVGFVRDLEEIRGKITKIRMNDFDEAKFRECLEILLKKVGEVDTFYFSKIKHKVNPLGKAGENSHIVNNIFCTKNWVESSLGFGKDLEEAPTKPLFIAGSYYPAMTPQARKNYHLQNPIISEKTYIESYPLGLAWLYSLFGIEDSLITKMINTKRWEEMHHNGARINEFFDNRNKSKENKPIPDIFEEEDSNDIKNQINKDNLESIGELRLVLRDREIRTIEDLHEGDYPVIRSILELMTNGLIIHSDEDNKMEIIELKVKYNEGEETRFSYALFLPVGNGLWNASEWLFFDEVSVENSWETVCDFKERYHKILEFFKDRIYFKSYFVDKKDLLEYRKRHDIAFRRKLSEIEQNKTSEGLLVELIAFFYYLKMNKDRADDFGWHVDPSNKSKTDLDAFFITGSKAEIIQAKKSINLTNPRFDLPIDETEKKDFDPVKHLNFEKDLKEIYEHFDKAEIIIKSKAKEESRTISLIEKKLFVFEKDFDDEDWLIEELKKELSKKGIDLIYFEEIDKDRNVFPKDLINKINTAFNRIIYEEDSEKDDSD